MGLKKLVVSGFVCAALTAITVPAMATPINGTATWTGVFTLTTGGVLSFCAPVTPVQTPCPASPIGPPGWNVPGSGTGDLAANGSDPLGGTINSLSSATNPVGVTLANPTLFVTFAGPPNDISFYTQTVFTGVGDPACTNAVGSTCTPPGSSVTFLNGSGGSSSATITIQGFARHAADAPAGFALATPLQMIFTAQFNQPYGTVLADFNSSGSLTSTYSVSFAATPIPQFTGCTVTQGGWGAPPHGNNPSAFLGTKFPIAFPAGVTIGNAGSPFSLHFTSAAAIRSFLPQGGPPNALAASATDPITSSAGVFAGQVLALDLNVALFNFGSLTLHGTGTSLDGATVAQVLAAANVALGGGSLPPGFTFSSLNDLIDKLNSAFDGCVGNSWARIHLT